MAATGPTTGTLHPAQRPYFTGCITLLPSDGIGSLITSPLDYVGWQMDCVSGYSWRQRWDAISPTKQGQYDWSRLDVFTDLCHRYNKTWSINLAAGIYSPSWIYDAGVLPYACDDGSGTMPIPWDPVYQPLYFEFLNAFNARYGADPLFRMIIPAGFMQIAQLPLGNNQDEINFASHLFGYADVDTAYTTSAQAILTFQTDLFRTVNFAVAFGRVFPDNPSLGQDLMSWYGAKYPGRGGISDSALYAIIPPYGPTLTDTTQHGYQAFLDGNGCCLKQNGQVNPDVYINPPGPPSPLPAYPQTLQDLLAAALTKSGMYVQLYQPELKDSRSLPVLQHYDRLLRANVPPRL